MNKSELSAALAIAKDKSVRFVDDNGKHKVDISIFDGYGLHNFDPVYCTLEQLAFLIRWQCFRMDGTVNAREFDSLCKVARTKFLVIAPATVEA